ncbi:MAG: NAD(P)H-hydrate dehydratase [Bryobacteraceae bacterium]
MFVLTAAQMREVDRRTVELGIPDAVLMENAGHRVVEFLERRFAPLRDQRIVVLCGKGNNGGDGIVIARQLFTRFAPRSLDVVLAEAPPANFASLTACGGSAGNAIAPEMRAATIVVDALLGTGLSGPPREPYADLIREINTGFPAAKIVAVDIPSGLASDHPITSWQHVHADATVTFTAPKIAQAMHPGASACGELFVGNIGSPASICDFGLRLTEWDDIAALFAPRPASAHKGNFGHVLVAGGWNGKTGATTMSGIAALRVGAGLVTVASSALSQPYPELMTDSADTPNTEGKTVIAVGPGMGTGPDQAKLIERLLEFGGPVVIDADGLNNLAGTKLPRRENVIVTPHPGEMSRLSGVSTSDIQKNRLDVARRFADDRGVTLVLKGRDTLIAFPEGPVWINPTGGPAMAKAGSGDILTGLIAGIVAQFPSDWQRAVVAAVWLHGRAGDLAAAELGDKGVLATDLLRYLPAAMRP